MFTLSNIQIVLNIVDIVIQLYCLNYFEYSNEYLICIDMIFEIINIHLMKT